MKGIFVKSFVFDEFKVNLLKKESQDLNVPVNEQEILNGVQEHDFWISEADIRSVIRIIPEYEKFSDSKEIKGRLRYCTLLIERSYPQTLRIDYIENIKGTPKEIKLVLDEAMKQWDKEYKQQDTKRKKIQEAKKEKTLKLPPKTVVEYENFVDSNDLIELSPEEFKEMIVEDIIYNVGKTAVDEILKSDPNFLDNLLKKYERDNLD